MATLPRIVEPPFYDPPMADYPSGQRHSQAWTEYHQSVSDRLTALHAGVTDGSDANAGDVGELLTASGGPVTLASGTAATIATLNLTPGDWDVSGNVVFSPSAGGTSRSFYGAGLDALDTYLAATFSTAALNQAMNTGPRRYNVSAATAVHVVAQVVFSGGTVTATATARARRMR